MGSRRESGDVSDEEFYDTEDIAFATGKYIITIYTLLLVCEKKIDYFLYLFIKKG